MSISHNLLQLFVAVQLVGNGLSVPLAAQSNWQIEPAGATWEVEGVIDGNTDVSGAALLDREHGWLVSDETQGVQAFTLDLPAGKLRIGTLTPLLAGKGKEIDLEGITTAGSGTWLYATGSHSVARKSGEVQQDRLLVFRVPVNAKTGALQTSGIQTSTLVPLITSNAQLHNALGQKSEQAGLDIEGLAEREGILYFGLRSPSVAGHAFIIEVSAGALFDDATSATHRIHELDVGAGFGIRDLARVSDGLLLIVGPSGTDESAHGFSLLHWAGPGGALELVGAVPTIETGKAEGILVLGESAEAIAVLLWFDGAENGTPMPLRLIKAKHKK